MEQNTDGTIVCPFNDALDCPDQKCCKCGWNPVVAERRLAKIKEEMNEVD